METTDPEHDVDGKLVRLTASLAAGVVSLAGLPLGVWSVGLLRDKLHVHCYMFGPESMGPGEWACSDGIGYIPFGFVLFVMWLATTVAGPIVAARVREGRRARRFLVSIAAASALWILGGTLLGAEGLVRDEHSPVKGPEFWVAAVGPSALLAALAIAALVALLCAGVAARALLVGGAILIGVATALEPGVGINLLPAAGLLAAAGMRSGDVTNRTFPAA